MSGIAGSAFGDGPTANGHYYLRGNYIEIGVHSVGVYGATDPAPAGFHPIGRSNIGFVADYGRDGWAVGTPPQSGDYFYPGSPEQGFTVQVDGTNYSNNLNGGFTEVTPTSLVETSSGPLKRTVWTGTAAGITVQRTTFFDVNASYFATRVRLTNGSGAPRTLRFLENVDPDQGLDLGVGFGTSNWVDKQPGYAGNTDQAWVYGQVTVAGNNIVLGLGTNDTRAKVYYGGFANRDASAPFVANLPPNPGTPVSADIAIALGYDLGSVPNGGFVEFEYYYVFLTGISITNLSVTPPPSTFLPAGAFTDITFAVKNLDLVDVSAALSPSASAAGWTATLISPATPVLIAAGATQSVVVRVTAPPGALAGDTCNVMLSATSSKGTASDFCVVAVPVPLAITCADWLPQVGTWGPGAPPCGDLTSTTTSTRYESESTFDVFTDFTYQATLTATRPVQPTASNTLFVRGNPTPLQGAAQTWNTGIAFNFTTNGKFSIFRYNGGAATPLQSWVAPVGVAINGSGLPNTLKVIANGGTLTFFINGVAVKAISGLTLLSGQVGVGMVRSVATTGPGPNDTLVVSAATVGAVEPGFGPRGPGEVPGKGVSREQQKANDLANAMNPNPDPHFDGGKGGK